MNTLLTIGGTLFIGEITSYLWHRYASHDNDNVVSFGHIDHHDITEKNWSDYAFQDFYWVSLILAITFPFAIIMSRAFSGLFMVSWATSLIYSIYKESLHALFHKETLLDKWSLFSELKRLHRIHHDDPTKNYAIGGFWVDKLMGTYSDVTPQSKEK